MYTITIVDESGNEIKVGTKCIYGMPPHPGEKDELGHTYDDYVIEVTEITDPDADYDDELGRGVSIPPFVKFKFNNGDEDQVRTYDITRVTWADYPDGPVSAIFEAGDLEVIDADS